MIFHFGTGDGGHQLEGRKDPDKGGATFSCTRNIQSVQKVSQKTLPSLNVRWESNASILLRSKGFKWDLVRGHKALFLRQFLVYAFLNHSAGITCPIYSHEILNSNLNSLANKTNVKSIPSNLPSSFWTAALLIFRTPCTLQVFKKTEYLPFDFRLQLGSTFFQKQCTQKIER